MRWLWNICAALVVWGGLTGCEDSLESIKDKRVIRLGVSYDLPPFSYVDSRGELGGIEVQLGRKLAKDLLGDESRVEFVTIASDQQEASALDSGAIDIALSCAKPLRSSQAPSTPSTSMLDTPAASSTAASTESMPYMHTTMSVLGGVDSPSGIQALLSPAYPARLLVRESSPAQAYFTENYPQIPLSACQSLDHCVQLLRQSQATSHDESIYFADIDIIAMLLAREYPDLTLAIESLGDPSPCAPRVKSTHTSLKTWLDREIASLRKEGVLTQSFFTQAFQNALERAQAAPSSNQP